MTSGTQSKEASSAVSHTLTLKAHPRVDGAAYVAGRSTSSNKAQALSIQLNNSGTTAVDGLFVNGFSHGKTKHSNNKTLRAVTAHFSKEGMRCILL
jgi:hypothetical protein